MILAKSNGQCKCYDGPPGIEDSYSLIRNDSAETTVLEKDGTYIIRYRAIQEYLKEERIQLI